jgi:hypothetical protein
MLSRKDFLSQPAYTKEEQEALSKALLDARLSMSTEAYKVYEAKMIAQDMIRQREHRQAMEKAYSDYFQEQMKLPMEEAKKPKIEVNPIDTYFKTYHKPAIDKTKKRFQW